MRAGGGPDPRKRPACPRCSWKAGERAAPRSLHPGGPGADRRERDARRQSPGGQPGHPAKADEGLWPPRAQGVVRSPRRLCRKPRPLAHRVITRVLRGRTGRSVLHLNGRPRGEEAVVDAVAMKARELEVDERPYCAQFASLWLSVRAQPGEPSGQRKLRVWVDPKGRRVRSLGRTCTRGASAAKQRDDLRGEGPVDEWLDTRGRSTGRPRVSPYLARKAQQPAAGDGCRGTCRLLRQGESA